MRVARAARTIEEATELTRVLELGVGEDRALSLGRDLDGLLDSTKLAKRGKLGEKFDKNNDIIQRTLNLVFKRRVFSLP